MECYYHPSRESTDVCAICGKSICKECGLEIAGKTYCKECLEKIVGVGLDNKQSQPAQSEVREEPVQTEPARLNKQPVQEDIYQPPQEPQAPKIEKVPQPEPEPQPIPEIKQINEDSPYNIKDNIEYSGNLESSYLEEPEPIMQAPEKVEQKQAPQQPQITQQPINEEPEFIYPDHNYEPQPTSARLELEDKYERYLDDLYFDEKEVPLNEQLAKDEEQYGSLTKKPYQPKEQKPVSQKKAYKKETPEEMEARIRAEILNEQNVGKDASKSIHNIPYKDEKEPMSVVDIILTIILVIVILIVIYYLIYIFLLTNAYPTFMDALYGLTNPQNLINNIMNH